MKLLGHILQSAALVGDKELTHLELVVGARSRARLRIARHAGKGFSFLIAIAIQDLAVLGKAAVASEGLGRHRVTAQAAVVRVERSALNGSVDRNRNFHGEVSAAAVLKVSGGMEHEGLGRHVVGRSGILARMALVVVMRHPLGGEDIGVVGERLFNVGLGRNTVNRRSRCTRRRSLSRLGHGLRICGRGLVSGLERTSEFLVRKK